MLPAVGGEICVMESRERGIVLAHPIVKAASILSVIALMGTAFAEEEKKPSPCTEDAVIVFDASGSMSGNQTLGIPNSRARIDEARAALATVVPNATKFRKVGLVTYGPGPYNQCNVKLEFKPDGQCGLPHHERREFTRACRANAADPGDRNGGGGARLPLQARRRGRHHRRRRDLRPVSLRSCQAASCRGLQADRPCDRLPL